MTPAETEDRAAMRKMLSEAVADGLRQAASDPEFFNSALAAMRKRTVQTAGNFVLDGIVKLAKSVAWVGVAIVAFYSLGGIPAIYAAAKAWFAAGGPP